MALVLDARFNGTIDTNLWSTDPGFIGVNQNEKGPFYASRSYIPSGANYLRQEVRVANGTSTGGGIIGSRGKFWLPKPTSSQSTRIEWITRGMKSDGTGLPLGCWTADWTQPNTRWPPEHDGQESFGRPNYMFGTYHARPYSSATGGGGDQTRVAGQWWYGEWFRVALEWQLDTIIWWYALPGQPYVQVKSCSTRRSLDTVNIDEPMFLNSWLSTTEAFRTPWASGTYQATVQSGANFTAYKDLMACRVWTGAPGQGPPPDDVLGAGSPTPPPVILAGDTFTDDFADGVVNTGGKWPAATAGSVTESGGTQILTPTSSYPSAESLGGLTLDPSGQMTWTIDTLPAARDTVRAFVRLWKASESRYYELSWRNGVLGFYTGVFAQPAAPGFYEQALASTFQAGMEYAGYNSTSYDVAQDERIDALIAAGVTDIAVIVTWYQATGTSTAIAAGANTPSDAGITRLAARIKAAGCRVFLRPYIDVSDGSFRGAIVPFDVTAWFTSYRTFINKYATLAQTIGVDRLGVGVEMQSMTTTANRQAAANTAAWQQVITEARARYTGKVVYSANWGELDAAEYQAVGFWANVDEIGIDAYFPLAAELGSLTDEFTALTNVSGFGGTSIVTGRLNVPAGGGGNLNGTFDIRGGYVQWDAITNPGLDLTIGTRADYGDKWTIQNYQGTLYLREYTKGSATPSDTTLAYNATNHRHLRGRHGNDGYLYFEASTNGTTWPASNWTTTNTTSQLRRIATTRQCRRVFINFYNDGGVGAATAAQAERLVISGPQWSANPTVADLAQAWTDLGWKGKIQALQTANPGKPVAVHEIAYAVSERTAARPYVQNTQGGGFLTGYADSQTAQSNAYQAFYDAMAPILSGVYWWWWRADAGAALDSAKDHSPRGKTAATTMTNANALLASGSGWTAAETRWRLTKVGTTIEVSTATPTGAFTTRATFTPVTSMTGLTIQHWAHVSDTLGAPGTFKITQVDLGADTIAPAAVTNLAAVYGGTPGSVSITWTASVATDLAAVPYTVEKQSGTTWATIKTTSGTSYVDQGVLAGTTNYRVTARDTSGNASTAATASVTLTTAQGFDTSSPPAPISAVPGFLAEDLVDRIRFSWDPNPSSEGVDVIQIWVKLQGGTYTTDPTFQGAGDPAAGGRSTTTITGLTPGQTYSYLYRAVNLP